jgi:hypothetical protein
MERVRAFEAFLSVWAYAPLGLVCLVLAAVPFLQDAES